MKYLITFIVIAIITFVTLNAKKSPNTPKKTTTTTPSPPPWGKWDGKTNFSAKEIVKNATELYYNETSVLFKLLKITLNQTRIINGTNRYRVKYLAARCVIKDAKKSRKSKQSYKSSSKYKKPKCFGTVKKNTPFQAIFRDNTLQHQLGLYVTNLENKKTYKKVYKQPLKRVKKVQKKTKQAISEEKKIHNLVKWE
uniref:Cystatin domain-containing protein n=1 Tax=Strongyloides venezuelensis TaxID=75913 RepID=A0A0K0G4D6_STRVS